MAMQMKLTCTLTENCPCDNLRYLQPRIRFSSNLGLPLGPMTTLSGCPEYTFEQSFALLGNRPTGSSDIITAQAGGSPLRRSLASGDAAAFEYSTAPSAAASVYAVVQRRSFFVEDAEATLARTAVVKCGLFTWVGLHGVVDIMNGCWDGLDCT